MVPARDIWRPAAVSTFVSVGNATQPFTRLVRAVAAIQDSLPQPVFVQFGVVPQSDRASLEGCDFLEMDEFERRIVRAELLILHAGAGSVIHAIRAGKVPVVMARSAGLGEHVDDHQQHFAAALQSAGKVVVAEGPSSLAAATQEALHRQRVHAYAPRPQPALVNLVRGVLLDCAKTQGPGA